MPRRLFDADDPGLEAEAFELRLDRLGHEFLRDIMSAELKQRPTNRSALSLLSQSLAHLGQYGEGRQVNQRLVELQPEHPVAHYNLACTLALTQDIDGALRELQQAVDLGFHKVDFMIQDPDLLPLHGLAPFEALVESMRDLRKADPR